MFEAVVSLCLAGAPEVCADRLLPGYEAATAAACIAALEAEPPDLERFSPLTLGRAPVCAEAQAPLAFAEVRPGVFVHEGVVSLANPDNAGDIANIGFVIGAASVAVIDAGTTRALGEGVWRAIRARTELPVSHVILTHLHPDHVLGAAVLAEAGAEVVGHEGLNRALADRADRYLRVFGDLVGAPGFLGTGFAPVTVPVDGTQQIDLGGRMLTLHTWPRAHTSTDLTVFDPASGVLFAGDLIFHRHTPSLDGSLRGWQAVLAQMAAIPATAMVPGHGGPLLAWPEGEAEMIRYLATLARETRAALDQGLRLGQAVDTVGQGEAAHWELFDIYNPQNASVAYTELEWE